MYTNIPDQSGPRPIIPVMARTPSCRYHCRRCGSHFTSLVAFDAHHQSSGGDLIPCAFPGEEALVEVAGGECRISGAVPQIGVTLYEHKSAALMRQRVADGDLRFEQAA